jgi:hypothetical protein
LTKLMIRVARSTSKHHSSDVQESFFDRISQDVLLNSLTFLRYMDLFHFSLTCRRFYELVNHVTDTIDNENTNIAQWIWKEMCLNEMQYFDKKSRCSNVALTEGNTTFKDQLRSLLFAFDPSTCPDATNLVLQNTNKTIKHIAKVDLTNDWKYIRCNKKLTPGNKYRWEFVLDRYIRHDSNMWWIILGVETTRPITPSHIGYWMAKERHQGIGLIIGTGEILYSNASFEVADNKIITFASGDVVGIEFDMTYSSIENDKKIEKLLHTHRSIYSSFYAFMRKKDDGDDAPELKNCGASIQFFKNGQSLGPQVRGIVGQCFYPAACILNSQQVTLRHWSYPIPE